MRSMSGVQYTQPVSQVTQPDVQAQQFTVATSLQHDLSVDLYLRAETQRDSDSRFWVVHGPAEEQLYSVRGCEAEITEQTFSNFSGPTLVAMALAVGCATLCGSMRNVSWLQYT